MNMKIIITNENLEGEKQKQNNNNTDKKYLTGSFYKK